MVELELRKLRHNSSDEQIQKVISLSNEIFQADPDSKYGSLKVWKERLVDESSVIIYFTPINDPEPIAFIFAHPRTQQEPLQHGSTESLHIWLAAVRPEYRKQKCLDRMVDELKLDAVRGGVSRLITLRTTPTRFERMWAWSQNRGWSSEREDIDEGGARTVLLSLFIPAGGRT